MVADTPLAPAWTAAPVTGSGGASSASGEGASSRVAPAGAAAPRALGSVISVLPPLSASASATFAAASGSKTVAAVSTPGVVWALPSTTSSIGPVRTTTATPSGLLDFATGPDDTGGLWAAAASSRATSPSTKSPPGRKSAPASRTLSAATDASCFRSRHASHSAT